MSTRLIVEVLDHYRGHPRHKLWLVAFAENANDLTRMGWPSRRLLAERVGVSESRASHIAAALIAEGVIKRTGGGYRGAASCYVLADLNGGRVRPERTQSGGDDYAPPW